MPLTLAPSSSALFNPQIHKSPVQSFFLSAKLLYKVSNPLKVSIVFSLIKLVSLPFCKLHFIIQSSSLGNLLFSQLCVYNNLATIATYSTIFSYFFSSLTNILIKKIIWHYIQHTTKSLTASLFLKFHFIPILFLL